MMVLFIKEVAKTLTAGLLSPVSGLSRGFLLNRQRGLKPPLGLYERSNNLKDIMKTHQRFK
jgi:hypothetical protein